MIKGMTGFGSADFSFGPIKGHVEIKSWNHRYLDVSYYLPPGLSSIETRMRELLQNQLERGKVAVSLRITQKPTSNLVFNLDVAKAHLKFAKQLQKELKIKDDISVVDIMKLPGVLEVKETQADQESLLPHIETSLKKALKELTFMRMREGKAITKDILDKTKRMMMQIKAVEKRTKKILQEKRKEFATPEEFQSFQKAIDVNEEISRLTHYVEEAQVLIRGSASAGKRLDFIAQEMQRETNTIGSKLQDKLVSNAVITLKSKIEKIREQSQNIE